MLIDEPEFRLLGPVGLWRGGRRLGPATAQQRTLLALQLLDLDSVVPTTKISTALWSAAPPASAQNAVQGYVARVRGSTGRGSSGSRWASRPAAGPHTTPP